MSLSCVQNDKKRGLLYYLQHEGVMINPEHIEQGAFRNACPIGGRNKTIAHITELIQAGLEKYPTAIANKSYAPFHVRSVRLWRSLRRGLLA